MRRAAERKGWAAVRPLLVTVLCTTLVGAQTKITAPKNSYTPEQDVELGREAAAEVRKEYPIITDERIDGYLDQLGRRLVAAAPAEFRPLFVERLGYAHLLTAAQRMILRNLERKSLAALDLDGHETAEEIKARYKTLVKQLHPDANGGDRSSEERLRQIIQAYHYLRSVGFC